MRLFKLTIGKVCGSGLKAVMLAAQAIQCGDAEIVIAGGMESMSRAPYLLKKARWGYRLGGDEIIDSMLSEGLTCAMASCHMGVTAENVAAASGLTRESQDEFAVESQRRAQAAIAAGHFDDEIVPLKVTFEELNERGKKTTREVTFTKDEGVRRDTSEEGLAKLKPAFHAKGTITAGNASQMSDGAAAVVVMSDERARELNLKPLARFVAYATAGCPPEALSRLALAEPEGRTLCVAPEGAGRTGGVMVTPGQCLAEEGAFPPRAVDCADLLAHRFVSFVDEAGRCPKGSSAAPITGYDRGLCLARP